MFEKEKRIYELSQVKEGMPESIAYQVPFRHLCNMLQTASGDIDAVIASLPDIKSEQLERFRRRCTCAWYWITECAPEEFRFKLKNPAECAKENLTDGELSCIQKIRTHILPKLDETEEKPLSQMLYDIASESGVEPKAMFEAVYRVLIGKTQGPRLAGFIKLIGREKLEALLAPYC